MKTTTCSGIEVTEFDLDVDTEDITLTPIDADAERWEALADAYADDKFCPACPFSDRGVNVFTGRPWRECVALHWSHCPALNERSIANALRRQAS
jgi:hypothetical protein